jgi:2-phospho-L-lactate/phosphoenolpyruvate guanylyltransferase
MAAVLVPIKAFAEAKVRLAPALDAAARVELARRLAARVIAAAAPLPVAVVCEDDGVADFAAEHGALVIRAPQLGLNAAVAAGVAHLAAAGHDEVIVAHADLPNVADLAALAGAGAGVVTLVPDRRDDGTNVLVVPADAGFRFCYGAGSFPAHRAEAERLGLVVHVVRDPRLAWDIDIPADLVVLECD